MTDPISQAKTDEALFKRLKPYIAGLVAPAVTNITNETTVIGGPGGGSGVTLSITDYGVVGNGTDDDDKVFQAALDEIGAAGGGYVWCKATGAAFVIASRLEVRSNTTLHFLSPITYKGKGQLSFFGEVESSPTLNQPRLRADALADQRVLQLGAGASDNYLNFSVGQKITLRGLSDGAGNATQKQSTFIVSINSGTNSLTVSDDLEFDFLAVYPPGDYEANFGIQDRTYIQKVTFARFTSNITAGTATLPVATTTGFAVGDYVELSDDTLILDLYPVSTYPESRSKNQFRIEMARIKAIDTVGNTITIDRNCYHDFDSAKYGGITKVLTTNDAHIIEAHATYIEDSPTRNYHSFQARMAVGCSFQRCSVRGDASYGGRGHGFRFDQALDCHAFECEVSDPKFYDSAEGYGFTLYGATHCHITNCYASNCRHTVLLFKGAAGNVIEGCVSVGCRISDYDCHGGNARYNLFRNNYAIGGPNGTPDSTNKSALKVGNTTHAVGDHYNTFEGNVVVDYPGAGYIAAGGTGSGIEIVPQSSHNVFKGNTLINCYRGFYTKSSTRFWDKEQFDNIIENNRFDGCTLELCYVGGDSDGYKTVTRFVFRNNTVSGCSRHLIIDGCNTVTVSGNTFENPGSPDATNKYTISISDSTGVTILDNRWIGTDRGVKLTNCPSAVVATNRMIKQRETIAFQDAGGNTSYLWHRNSYVGFGYTYSGIGTSTGGTITEEGGSGGGGGVASVSASSPLVSTGGASPDISIGTLAQNAFIGGPSSGGAGLGTARAITAADLPTHMHGLADLLQGTATTGQVATWTGAAWAPVTPSAGSMGGSIAANQVPYASGVNTLTGSDRLQFFPMADTAQSGTLQIGAGAYLGGRGTFPTLLEFSAGAYFDGTNWRTRTSATAAAIISAYNGDIEFYTNSGLAANTAYTPTRRFAIYDDGMTEAGRFKAATFETSAGQQWQLGSASNTTVGLTINGVSRPLAPAGLPVFNVHKNSVQTGIGFGGAVKVTWTTENVDTGSWFDLANSRLVVGYDCTMLLCLMLQWSVVSDQKSVYMYIYKNGSAWRGTGTQTSGTGSTSMPPITLIESVGSGDVLEVYVEHFSSGSTYAISGYSAGNRWSGKVLA